jgi:uncharacterized integral membrane protein
MTLRIKERELLRGLLSFVLIYSVLLYVVDGSVVSVLFWSGEFWLPGGYVFIAGLVIGGIIAFAVAGGRAGRIHGRAIGLGIIFILAAAVGAAICGAFLISHQNQDEHRAVIFGFASALAWGLSVVGGLMLLPTWWYPHRSYVIWTSWLNFFAAGFAALAVGYMPTAGAPFPAGAGPG